MNFTQIDPTGFLPGMSRTHPSIMEWSDRRWLAYRLEQVPFNKHTRVALAFCDWKWNPLTSHVLNIPLSVNPYGQKIAEDCRLFIFQGELYFSVSDRYRMGIGKLDECGNVRGFGWLSCAGQNPIEKNWQFFEHGETLCGIRWVHPHEIYLIDLRWWRGHRAFHVHKNDYDWNWEYGEPHGSVSPVKYGNLFIGFLHSFILDGFPPYDTTKHTLQQTIEGHRIYFAAPYAFSAEPPFQVKMLPKEPFLWPKLRPPERRNPNGDDLIFPTGLVRDGDKWTCTYGDDINSYKVEFSTAEMFENLRPV